MIEWNDICILHIDLDAFFASVEKIDNPDLEGKPVIVGGKPSDRRAVVCTASYEARKFGVHSAMPITKAYSLCPQGVYISPRMERYHEKSQEVMEIFSDFSPEIRQISVDEAFINLSGTQRLFGNPSDTARKIKAIVKEKTGLTVSIGLAQNRYIAKIASGLSKPDGFYEVPPGTEEGFMLSLPIEKVWGIGSKTQKRLYDSGFKTTKDIHSKSLPLLQSIFGEAAGSFLYNAVRGKEVETFSESKSHSLSAETTFSFDLTDRYAIGTALMELAYTVMFRLIKENKSSKTISVKIRYGDFTTVSIQETLDSEIFSAEELFERAEALFDKKYDKNLGGVRLLGLAVQNIGQSALQREMFEENGEKKRAVEKSILELQNKKPEIKIKKARLLNKNKKIPLIAFPLLLAAMFFGRPLFAETMNQTNVAGAGAIVFDESALPPQSGIKAVSDGTSSIFNYSINDRQIEFLADGYWESAVAGTAQANFGFGNPLVISTAPPVFTQKVDLTLWFMLDKKWYFEAAFADGFDKNTVAAGYYGEGTLKEVRVANRGITFPKTYSIDNVNRGIGGGNNEAPGVSLHFEDDEQNKWKGDFAFRYDMLESRSKTYYGKNSVNDSSIPLSKWLSGRIYVLPDSPAFISDIRDVYVENSNGTYTDLQGRKYKKLSESEYILLPVRRQIILSQSAGATIKNGIVPAVAVSFFNGSTYTALRSALGAFGSVQSDGTLSGASGFLGEIQKFFGSAAVSDGSSRPNVASFSYGGVSVHGPLQQGSYPVPDHTGLETDGFFSKIGGTSGIEVLFIQHPAGFSPFTAAFRYDGGVNPVDSAVVASSSTQTESELFLATAADDLTFTSQDYTSQKHNYVDVFRSDVSASANSLVNPEVRYPLADIAPGCYLGYETSSDLYLRLRSYSAVSRFDIGTDAVPGTVRLYKNGVIDGAAKYDAESGIITPSSSISGSDRIYITWYEQSAADGSGAVAAAAGYSRQFTSEWSGDLSFSTRWPYNPKINYADASNSQSGFATVAAGLEYATENFMFSNTAAATLESPNVSGKYRVLAMDDRSPDTVNLSENSGTDLPEGFTPSLNARKGTAPGNEPPRLSYQYNGSQRAENGSTDPEISGYKIPVSWDFSSWEGQSVCAWAATTIDLGPSASLLAAGTEFSIAIKPQNTSVTNYDVYLQLGVSADDDFTVEDSGSVPTWKISDVSTPDVRNPFNPANGTFSQNIVKIRLTQEDVSRLSSNRGARIIIVVNATSTGSGHGNSISDANSNKTGTLWVGPYEIQTQGVFTSQADKLKVTNSQTKSDFSGCGDFNSSANYVQNVDWKNSDDSTVDKTDITITRYFSEVDISPYKKINLYFRFEPKEETPLTTDDSACAFTLTLDRNSKGISSYGKTALRLEIPRSEFKNYADSLWHKLTVDRSEKKVTIDGKAVAVKDLLVDTKTVPSRLKMTIATAMDGKLFKSGRFSFDELYLSDTKEYYILEDNVKTSYKKDGVILAAGKFPLLENFSFKARTNSAASIRQEESNKADSSLAGSASAGVTLATIAFSGEISGSTSDDTKLSNAGHKIETTDPLFGIFSAAEEYRYDPVEKSLHKQNGAGADLKTVGVPLDVYVNTEAVSNAWHSTQKSSVQSDLSLASQNLSYFLTAKFSADQRLLPSHCGVKRIDSNSYFQGWKDSSALAFSTGKENASGRNVAAGISNVLKFPYMGFSPQADISCEGRYSSSKSVLFTDSAKIKLKFPFSIGSNNLIFQWAREAGGTKNVTAGGDYGEDVKEISDSLGRREYFFKALPFHDMVSASLPQKVFKNTSALSDVSGNEGSLYYSTIYDLSWRRPVWGSIRDLLLPTSVSLSASRDIRTSARISDIYQYKAALNYTAFNIFGQNGTLMRTSLFKQDEYTASVSAAAKIPRDSGERRYVYDSYVQANFYYNDTDTVRLGGEISFETSDIWATRATVIWKRRGKTSPLLAAVTLFKPDYNMSGVVLTRSDSVNISFSENETYSTTNSKVIKRQAFELNHSADMKLNGNLTIFSFLSETYNCTWDKIILLTIKAGLGMRVEF
ncbi:DNA polymerase IV [Treponema parvum]|uniref:DNA polymerase IV n=1 Tax=Treponema parvum TaxID=138851 RepID=UPI001AEC0868|nr:DNA polymerase IV [Treponema parvum]QTQ16386.1 DNA polymerase IV [Treponema parvum]